MATAESRHQSEFRFQSDGAVRFLAAASARRTSIQNDWSRTQSELQAIWPRKGHAVVAIVHEGDGCLDGEDANDVLELLHGLRPDEPLDVILHTHGGSAAAANRIAAALVKRRNTAAFVPFYAESAGTEVALATQQIYFGRDANLSPIDIHIDGTSARDIVHLASEKGGSASEGLRLAAKVARRALHDEARTVASLIHPDHKKAGPTALAAKLTGGRCYHGELIRIARARRLGINAKNGVPAVLYGFIGKRRAQLRQLRELEQNLGFIRRREPAQDESVRA
ncbi:MAG TPA: hypothetical protein VMU01_03400 [Rhizomicrobium sp.]|nr:hypothetical protein [Rhizomicrobium sp.]